MVLLQTGCAPRIDETVAGTWRIDTEATFDSITDLPAWKKLSNEQRTNLRAEIESKSNVLLTFAPGQMSLKWQDSLLGNIQFYYVLEHLQQDSFRAVHPDDPEKTFSMTLKILDESNARLRVLSERFEPWMRYVLWRRVSQ